MRYSFMPVLQLILIVLKAIGIIHWSWLWVLSPLWITAVLTLIIAVVVIIVSAAASVIAYEKKK